MLTQNILGFVICLVAAVLSVTSRHIASANNGKTERAGKSERDWFGRILAFCAGIAGAIYFAFAALRGMHVGIQPSFRRDGQLVVSPVKTILVAFFVVGSAWRLSIYVRDRVFDGRLSRASRLIALCIALVTVYLIWVLVQP